MNHIANASSKIRIREFPESNYRAVFLPSGRTLHFKYDRKTELQELAHPEIYDIGINSKCFGRCSYCYIEAVASGTNFKNIVEKTESFFGSMSENERPFQVAIGASGEPTIHPDFIPFMAKLRALGIMPNYTTNGMHLSERLLKATAELCGGVALTTHKHLERHWRNGIEKLYEHKIRTNLHLVIMSKDDVDIFLDLYDEYSEKIEYFVLLPYQAVGFAEKLELEETHKYLFSKLDEMDLSQVAYGAYFYDELKKRPHLKADIYPHFAISKYLSLEGDGSLYRSSFEWKTPIKEGLF